MTNDTHGETRRSLIWRIAVALAAFSRRLIDGLVRRTMAMQRALVRAVRRAVVWVVDTIYALARTITRFYFRVESAIAGLVTDTIYLAWSFRSLAMLVAIEAGLIYLSLRWPWFWLLTTAWTTLLAMGTRDALRRETEESLVTAEATFEHGRRRTAGVVKWGLRLTLTVSGVLFTLWFAGTGALASLGESAHSLLRFIGAETSVDPPQYLIRTALDRGPPVIRGNATAWTVTLTDPIHTAVQRAVPGFQLCGSQRFASTSNSLLRPKGVEAAPNAVIADFNGDGRSDVVLVGMGPTPTVVAAISSASGVYGAAILPTQWRADCSSERRTYLALRYVSPGTSFSDRSGRRLRVPAVSLWDPDVGGDMFYVDRGRWVHIPLVGD